MKNFPECFKVILTGEREASRKASREVSKILYGSQSGYNKKYEDIESILNAAPNGFEKISEEWRQVNFVISVSVIYFLRSKNKQPDFLFLWLYQLIQHPNGNIRFAAVRMFEIELGPLTYHIRFPDKKHSSFLDLSPGQADQIILELFKNLMNMMHNLWKPAYKKYKYISSLPTGQYKSVQMIFGRLEELCGEEYLTKLRKGLEYH